MSVSTGRFQLANAYKSVTEAWDQTETHWRDSVREQFVTDYWNTLVTQVPMVLTGLDQLDVIFTRIRIECSPDDGAA